MSHWMDPQFIVFVGSALLAVILIAVSTQTYIGYTN